MHQAAYPQYKVCPKCGKALTLENFYVDHKSKDGLTSYCKSCAKDNSLKNHDIYRGRNAGFPFILTIVPAPASDIRKACPKCGRMLPLGEFHKDITSSTGYASWCKDCKNGATTDVCNPLQPQPEQFVPHTPRPPAPPVVQPSNPLTDILKSISSTRKTFDPRPEAVCFTEHKGFTKDGVIWFTNPAQLDLLEVIFDRITELRSMPYQDYLQTPEWRARKKLALRYAGHKCQMCGKSHVQLNVHHNNYKRKGMERLSDLVVLCRDCHAHHHRKEF